MTAPTIQYVERRGKYNMYADPKLEKLIEEIVPIGSWGKCDKAVAMLARPRKSVEGGRRLWHNLWRRLRSLYRDRMLRCPILCANYGENHVSYYT